MKTVIKFLVIPAILLMTSCLSDVQKRVKQDYGLDKIMCGYAGNKNTAQVVMDEVEARLDRFGIILKDIKAGKTDRTSKQYEIMTLVNEIVRLCDCPNYIVSFQGDVISSQAQRIDGKIKQIEKDVSDLGLEELLD